MLVFPNTEDRSFGFGIANALLEAGGGGKENDDDCVLIAGRCSDIVVIELFMLPNDDRDGLELELPLFQGLEVALDQLTAVFCEKPCCGCG